MYEKDPRIVLTLDAGGTNLVFSAIQANQEIVQPITIPTHANDLEKCLASIIEGFSQVKEALPSEPAAISFSFPGPADYEHGVIGDLGNFPAFRGGIALGPYIEEHFKLPTYINNDGKLFAYGEALSGALPEVNDLLREAKVPKRYKNLLGITLGTGFGGGVVSDNVLLMGDNGCAGNVWCAAYKFDVNTIAEEGASIRAVQRVYRKLSGDATALTPKDIYEIAESKRPGDREAAVKAFETLGEAAGFTIGEASNIVDGIVVIGGGVSKASKYILPSLVKEMNARRNLFDGSTASGLESKVYDLTDAKQLELFLVNEVKEVKIPGTDKVSLYDTGRKIGVTVSRLGASTAISLGAYAFALHSLDKRV